MGVRRLLGDLREARALLAELASNADADERARLELAVSARRFSRRTKKVVDDKLNFSAVLMRAGEVQAANRLLVEFEEDVRSEEAALIEKVNEVRVFEHLRRERITRARLVRSLVAAMVGASLLAFSAAGIAVAGMFRDEKRASLEAAFNAGAPDASSSLTAQLPETAADGLRRVKIGGVNVALSPAQLDAYNELTTGDIDEAELRDLLLALPTAVAQRVQALVDAAKGDVFAAIDQSTQVLGIRVTKSKKKRQEREEPQQQEPAAQETPEPAEEEPEPEPSDPGDGSDGEDGGDDSGDSSDPDGSGPLPGLDDE